MAYTVLGIKVDFSRLVAQRMSTYYHGTAHPWLALGYVVIQALAALLPGTVQKVAQIHEGLTRDLIGSDPSRRTGRYGWNVGGWPTLFIVPGIYTPESYARSRIWMLRGFGLQTCLSVLRDLWRQVGLDHHPIVAELMYRSIPYVVLFQRTGAREYVTTNISQFPESPAVPVVNALGMKTIMWMFGDQHVLPTTTGPSPWIVPAAIAPAVSEVHLWTDTARWLWDVNLTVNPKPRLIVDGPRMLGLKPASFPPSRCIGIADTRAKRSTPADSVLTAAWVEAFYRDCYRVLSVQPELSVCVKSKYAEHLVVSSNYKQWLCLLTQVEELDPDSNPWTLLERCGLIICLPYSSMGVAALAVGREVIFYDPTDAAAWYPDEAMRALRVVGREALKARVMAWRKEVQDESHAAA